MKLGLQPKSVIAEELAESLHSARILVVDDLSVMCKMIGLTLKKGGYTNVSFAYDGNEALEAIAVDMPDLVILDINMPRLNGYEVCRKLRSQPETAHLPILVQSAAETDAERVKVFEAGGTDFVSKPINLPEMLARVSMHLGNKFLIKSLSSFRERLQSELRLARDMQVELLPATNDIWRIQKKYSVTIDSFYRASSELGGDLWGFVEVSDTQLGVYLIDVVGHGVAAALNTFRVQALMTRLKALASDPSAFMTALNSALVDIFPTGQYATMFYGVLDTDADTLTWCGGAAPRPYLMTPGDSQQIQTIDTRGVPIGISRKPGYANLVTPFVKNQLLFAYSDVLLETPDIVGEILGEEGLRQLVQQVNSRAKCGQVLQETLRSFFEKTKSDLKDDLTAVSIFRSSEGIAFPALPDLENEQILIVSDGAMICSALTALKDDAFDAIHASDMDDVGRYLTDDSLVLSTVIFDLSVSGDHLDRWIKFILGHAHLALLPIVAVRDMSDSMNLGHLYNSGVTKVVEVNVKIAGLRRVLKTFARDHKLMINLKRDVEWRATGSQQISEGEFRFQSRAEAYDLARKLGTVTSDPVRVAIGLTELLVNAIEHGCFQIGASEKSRLIDQDRLDEELNVRHMRPEFRDRFATVKYTRGYDFIEFIITDPGEGFDYENQQSAFQNSSAAASGRGLMMADQLFTSLAYSGKGNIVIARIAFDGIQIT